jgi:formate hydrogenlyase transcriptional activator
MSGEALFPSGDDVSSFMPSTAVSDPERLFAAYSATAGLCILDSEHRYLWINGTLAKLHGVTAADHLGKTPVEVVSELAAIMEPHLCHAFSTGEPVLNVEVSFAQSSDGDPVHWLQHYFPIRAGGGKVTRVGIVAIEITEQKKLEKAVHDLDAKLQKQVDRLHVLLDITRLLSSNWDVPLVFPTISANIRRVLRQEYASFALYQPDTNTLVRQAIDFPLSKGLVFSAPIAANGSPAGRSLRQSKPIIYSKRELQGFDARIARSLLDEGIESLCCVPLMRPNGPMGVLVLGSTRENAFAPDDLNLLDPVATQLALALENHRAAFEIKKLRQRLGDERKYLESEAPARRQFPEIVGDSAAVRQVLDQVAIVANSEATVLILGETGTGKELIAQAIHRLSRRKEGAFIKVNCAAIPTGLLESELFGHEKGAFTGAISQKIGRMELADGGTLFLDEVGEIPLEVQPKLLRVLQDQEFERLGSNRTIKVNLRIIAATNRKLRESIERHEFRTDLYYRLSVFPIFIPPLRERPEDIPLLVSHFVHKSARRMNRYIETIPRQTMEALTKFRWPGNVRELENLMERSVILSESTALCVPLSELRLPTMGTSDSSDQTLDTAERQHIIRMLRETRGVLSGPDGAARRLGLKRTTLQSKMHRLRISRQDYLDASQA